MNSITEQFDALLVLSGATLGLALDIVTNNDNRGSALEKRDMTDDWNRANPHNWIASLYLCPQGVDGISNYNAESVWNAFRRGFGLLYRTREADRPRWGDTVFPHRFQPHDFHAPTENLGFANSNRLYMFPLNPRPVPSVARTHPNPYPAAEQFTEIDEMWEGNYDDEHLLPWPDTLGGS
ncbi:hypothetical protein GGS23DRAFT_593415 [Durotheca rogersii]|uniref:uncharacterized protein n=1 Tax=Durotheca rogersii TaxID=419775 RepID=UPI002220DB5E|nr:uncharacterized protein GGS23DRAFT_593415 [Durotheca rogersii]KAI5866680.1 hypothetical protein GGS23DRAFT_593415 [Durotheca rogersii]